jgi:Fe-S-cluster containining protein
VSEERQILKEVPSGKIELVWNGTYSTLQFNGECTEMLPYCKAMCCRLRQGFTVLLEDSEVAKYKNRPFPQDPQLRVLERSEDGNSCYYLDAEKSLCTIHGQHPLMCQKYHCSPGGKGHGVKHRDGGWLWTPMGCLQQLGDGTVIDIREISQVKIGG